MRFLSLLLLCLITQSALSQQTKVSFRLMELMSQSENSNKIISVLIKGDFSKIAPEIEKTGGTVKFKSGNICSASMRVSSLRTLTEIKSIERIEEGRVQVQTLNDKMLINNRIDLIHQGVSPLIQGYDGSNVVVGIIDTGIDFTHPDFKDSLGLMMEPEDLIEKIEEFKGAFNKMELLEEDYTKFKFSQDKNAALVTVNVEYKTQAQKGNRFKKHETQVEFHLVKVKDDMLWYVSQLHCEELFGA